MGDWSTPRFSVAPDEILIELKSVPLGGSIVCAQEVTLNIFAGDSVWFKFNRTPFRPSPSRELQ